LEDFLQSEKDKDKVINDSKFAWVNKIKGTPGFYVNGEKKWGGGSLSSATLLLYIKKGAIKKAMKPK